MKPASRKRILAALATILTACLLSACNSETRVADGGIHGTGSSVGPVSGFGSVYVNGVEFITKGIRNRKVISNDGVDTEEDLDKGMILRIDGEWDKDGAGEADSMEYDDSLRGEISELQKDRKADKRLRFKVHNQPVFADSQTVLKGKRFANIENGDFVRVSAWRQADGKYRASYIGVNPDSYGRDPVEVEGPVDKKSVTDSRFTMNGLTIDYSNADFADDVSESELQAGAYFEAEGKIKFGVLKASRIQRNDFRRYLKQGGEDDIELSGLVSSDYKNSSQSFGLNGLTIRVTGETDLDNLELADLTAGVLVQVEGTFVSPKVIKASEIEAREGDVEVEGNIDQPYDSSTGMFKIGGVRVHVTSRTIITDDDDDGRLTLDDLDFPVYPPRSRAVSVEVSGFEAKDKSGSYVEALQIERELSDEKENEYEIEARLESISGQIIKLLGVRIKTSGAEFEEGVSLGKLQTKLGKKEKVVLEVEYEADGSGYRATEVELD